MPKHYTDQNTFVAAVERLKRDMEQLGVLNVAMESLGLDEAEVRRQIDDVPAPEALAADDYVQAWIPVDSAKQLADLDGQAEEVTHADGVTLAQASAAAVAIQRRREQIVKSVADKQDREKRLAAQRVYRVVAVFTESEGELVRRVLGTRPAEMILDLCRRYDKEFS